VRSDGGTMVGGGSGWRGVEKWKCGEGEERRWGGVGEQGEMNRLWGGRRIK